MINIATKPLNEREAKGEKPSLDNRQSFTEVTDIRVLGNIGWISYCYQHRPVRGVITPMLMVECPLLWLKTWITGLTLDAVEYFLPF